MNLCVSSCSIQYWALCHTSLPGIARVPLLAEVTQGHVAQEGQDVTAYIAEVDTVNGRVQLWAEPPKASLPLNQTLDDLLRGGTSEGPQSDEVHIPSPAIAAGSIVHVRVCD